MSCRWRVTSAEVLGVAWEIYTLSLVDQNLELVDTSG
jgi:hypothetical protein